MENRLNSQLALQSGNHWTAKKYLVYKNVGRLCTIEDPRGQDDQFMVYSNDIRVHFRPRIVNKWVMELLSGKTH